MTERLCCESSKDNLKTDIKMQCKSDKKYVNIEMMV